MLVLLLGGLGTGLYYGWVVSPVEYVDTTPAMLRADFRADYTLMAAEIFNKDQDSEAAARRLALLGSAAPEEYTSTALTFAKENQFAQADIDLLQSLNLAMQVWQPRATPQATTSAAPLEATPVQP